jgi:hypothetical protein
MSSTKHTTSQCSELLPQRKQQPSDLTLRAEEYYHQSTHTDQTMSGQRKDLRIVKAYLLILALGLFVGKNIERVKLLKSGRKSATRRKKDQNNPTKLQKTLILK